MKFQNFQPKKLALIFVISILFSTLAPDVTNADIKGIASWYGGGEKLNKHTANGEVFNPTELTCASWDYPFGTRLVVTNIANGKSVIVRVNDRGPNKRLGRAIDLTKCAFSRIADLNKGLISVRVAKI